MVLRGVLVAEETSSESLKEGDAFVLANGAIRGPRFHVSKEGARNDRGAVVALPSGTLVYKIVFKIIEG